MMSDFISCLWCLPSHLEEAPKMYSWHKRFLDYALWFLFSVSFCFRKEWLTGEILFSDCGFCCWGFFWGFFFFFTWLSDESKDSLLDWTYWELHLQKSRRPIRVCIWVIQTAGGNRKVERTLWAKVAIAMLFVASSIERNCWRGI